MFDDAAAAAQRAVTHATGRVEPDPAWVEQYTGHRARYQALYPALSALPA